MNAFEYFENSRLEICTQTRRSNRCKPPMSHKINRSLNLGSAFVRSATSTRFNNIPDPNPMPIKDGLRPTLKRDRKRKIADRKSAVFDLAKSFSFREQKLSCVRSKNRLGFSCEVSGMPTAEVQTYRLPWYTCTCRKLL